MTIHPGQVLAVSLDGEEAVFTGRRHPQSGFPLVILAYPGSFPDLTQRGVALPTLDDYRPGQFRVADGVDTDDLMPRHE